MAKGLFSVYQDSSTSTLPSTTSSKLSQQQPQIIKRQLFPSSTLLLTKNEKENSNPFYSSSLGSNNGMIKKPNYPSKGSCVEKKSTFLQPQSKSVLSSTSINSQTQNKRIIPLSSFNKGIEGNGICTGILRTREIDFTTTSNSIQPQSIPTHHSDSSNSNVFDSPSSAKDSGYASTVSRNGFDSNDSRSNSSNSGSDSDSDMDLVGDDNDDVTMKLNFGGDTNGDRRARALTESPLAEITQAFTSFGSFSLSPTPIISQNSFSNQQHHSSSSTSTSRSPIISPTRFNRKSTTSTTSTLVSASNSSAMFITVKPTEYSTTATTRKVKVLRI